MISQKELNLKENSRVFLKVTVPQSEVKREYDDLVTKYCEKVAIKGFRRGKVPREILLRKYGEEIKSETALTIIQKGVEEALKDIEEKPLNYSHPSITEKVDLDPGRDFTFEVSYDTFPKIELGPYKAVKVEKPIVTVGQEDIERELEILREKNSIVKEKQGAVARGDIVTVDYVELDADGKPIDGTKREGFVLEVGKLASVYKFDDALIGLNLHETKTVTAAVETETPNDGQTLREATLQVTVKSIMEKILPDLNDELAQDVSEKYKTFDDLKADIEKKLAETAEEHIRDILFTVIVEKIVATSTIPVPETMIVYELAQKWQDLVERFNKREDLVLRALQKEGKTKDDLFAGWRPNAERKIKAELVIDAVEDKEKITASDEEVSAEIKKYADERGLEFDKAKEAYEKMGMIDYLKRSIVRKKVVSFLIDNADVKKGKKVKFLDLLEGKY